MFKVFEQNSTKFYKEATMNEENIIAVLEVILSQKYECEAKVTRKEDKNGIRCV